MEASEKPMERRGRNRFRRRGPFHSREHHHHSDSLVPDRGAGSLMTAGLGGAVGCMRVMSRRMEGRMMVEEEEEKEYIQAA